MVPFTAGMWDHIIQKAPSASYGTLLPVLSTRVGRTVHVAAWAVVDLGEIELARQRGGAQQVQGKERGSTISVQAEGKGSPVKVTTKQLCMDFIRARVVPKRIDKQPHATLVAL